MHLDSAPLHLGHGWRLFTPCTSIPLRFISVTAGASLRHAPRFRSASSRSRLAPFYAMHLDSAPLHLGHGWRRMLEIKSRAIGEQAPHSSNFISNAWLIAYVKKEAPCFAKSFLINEQSQYYTYTS